MMMKLHGLVQWEDSAGWYTEVGKHHKEDRDPALLWQPIEFEIPKKPKAKKKEKAWQWVCKTGNKYWLTRSYYSSKEDINDRFHISEIIEPFLPSEIERDVKE